MEPDPPTLPYAAAVATKLSDHRRGVRLRLALAVVAGGAASLGTEICAARLVSPYFGDSILVWANIIGVVLAALSAGYWLGGRFADIRPYPRALGVLLLLAAAAELLLSTVATTVLTATERNGVLGGSLSAVIVLFSAPTLLLGMVAHTGICQISNTEFTASCTMPRAVLAPYLR